MKKEGKKLVGKLAVSCAGHDRDKIYLITGETDAYVYLADGRLKTWSAPKKKNRKHICLLPAGLSGEELRCLAANPADADTRIKRCIKIYERNSQRVWR